MPTKPPADALTFAPDVTERLASFQVDFGRGTLPPPGEPDHKATKPRDVMATAKERTPGPRAAAHKVVHRVDAAAQAMDELRTVLGEHREDVPHDFDLAAVERVSIELATLRAQSAAWLFEVVRRNPPRGGGSREYQRAVLAAIAASRVV